MAGTPFEGPVSGVKLSRNEDGTFIYDPSFQEEESALLTVIVAGTSDAITMVEASGKQVSNEVMLETLQRAHEIIIELCQAQENYLNVYGQTFGESYIEAQYNLPDETLYEMVAAFLTEEKLSALYNTGKKEFQTVLDSFDAQVKEFLIEEGKITPEDDSSFVGSLVYKRVKEVMRSNVLQGEKRLDGRALHQVRPILCETGILPRPHGSGLFRRGMTQVLSIATLGGPEDQQILDGMHEETQKRYIHHYNFPPYSVGEVRMLRGVGRREIGHGFLAEKALVPVLPSEQDFPYMIRVVSEVTTCNGSSSMGSVCGSTLALMHAGVPISAPVSGVAMGMIYDENSGNYKILSDIQAQEDFL